MARPRKPTSRRHFLPGVAITALLLGTSILVTWPKAAPAAGLEPEQPRPNFVVIVTDDQRWDSIGRCLNGFDPLDMAAGSDSCMPNLQRLLVANGTQFQRGYVTTSLCCPARASILTGRYARHTGVVDQQTLNLLDDTSTLATWLGDAGYATALIGKYGNGYGEAPNLFPANYVPPGWDSWHAFWGLPGYRSYSLVDRDPGQTATTTAFSGTGIAPTACAPGTVFSTDLLCRKALDFLAADAGDPFFLYFAPFAPHLREGDRIMPSRWSTAFSTVPMPQYPNYNRPPSPNPPSWIPSVPLPQTLLDRVAREERDALRSTLAVDDAIGLLYQQLVSDGRIDDTVWFFISDNSLGRGEHRWNDKGCAYEECHHVPFVVSCPTGICPAATSGTVDEDHIVLNIDIAPTIAELAGVAAPPMDGRSLLPILDDPSTPWRSSFLLEDHGITPTNRPLGIEEIGADGHTYKYIESVARPNETELYDLTTDPWELINLSRDGLHGGLEAALAAELHDTFNPPVTLITSGPAWSTVDTTASFTWRSDKTATFECRLDADPFAPCGSGTSGGVTFEDLSVSSHAFQLRATDEHANTSTAQRNFAVVTQLPPDASLPSVSMSQPTTDQIRNTNSITAAWSGSDDTGIAVYELYERSSPSGSQVLVQGSTATSYARTGALGRTYCYQVIAYDLVGKARTGPERCTGVPVDDRSAAIVYSGAVTPLAMNGAFLNTLTVLGGPGQQAAVTFTGRRYGVIVQRGPSYGMMDVYLDGTFVRRVDLYAPGNGSRNIIHQQAVTSGAHTVTLVWTGARNPASTGTALPVDGFAVIGDPLGP